MRSACNPLLYVNSLQIYRIDHSCSYVCKREARVSENWPANFEKHFNFKKVSKYATFLFFLQYC